MTLCDGGGDDPLPLFLNELSPPAPDLSRSVGPLPHSGSKFLMCSTRSFNPALRCGGTVLSLDESGGGSGTLNHRDGMSTGSGKGIGVGLKSKKLVGGKNTGLSGSGIALACPLDEDAPPVTWFTGKYSP